MDFQIGYSANTFCGIIKVGSFTVAADSIKTVKEEALNMVITSLKNDDDEEDDDGCPIDGLQNVSISVSEVK